MTAIDHHSMIVDSNCTNSTIATMRCACAAPAVVVSVGLQTDRRLGRVASLSLTLCNERCSLFFFFCQYLEHQFHHFSIGKKCFPTAVFRSIRTVNTINLCFFISSANIVFIQSLFSHSFTACAVTLISCKDGTEASLSGTCQSVLGSAMILCFFAYTILVSTR